MIVDEINKVKSEFDTTELTLSNSNLKPRLDKKTQSEIDKRRLAYLKSIQDQLNSPKLT